VNQNKKIFNKKIMHLLLPLLQSKYVDKIADKLSAQGLDNE
jgi:hypothetical protein